VGRLSAQGEGVVAMVVIRPGGASERALAPWCEWAEAFDADGLDAACGRVVLVRLTVLAEGSTTDLGLCDEHAEEVRALPTVVDLGEGRLVMRWA
jgi:hypothetical protein